MKIEQSQVWLEHLQSLKAVVESVPADSLWNNSNLVVFTLKKLISSFEGDLQDIENEMNFIFSAQDDSISETQQITDIIRKWHIAGRAPSMAAFCAAAADRMGLELDSSLKSTLMMAALLGEVENDVYYHNNMHFLKVLLHTARLVAAHNDIYAGTPKAFTDDQSVLLLIAACVHDLGHDGLGNTIRGVFYQGRLEKRSIALAQPYLEAVGFNDPNMLTDLRTVILCTEVTPLDDPGNPMNQMKAAYRYHFMGEKSRTHTLNLDADLVRLQLDPKLTMMALVLHEADIATSAGLTYDITKFETSIYMSEIGTKQARPSHIVDFINQVCQRRFLSDAGQRLYASSLARIYALAEEDVKAGDHELPAPQHSDFMLLHGKSDGAAKTIN